MLFSWKCVITRPTSSTSYIILVNFGERHKRQNKIRKKSYCMKTTKSWSVPAKIKCCRFNLGQSYGFGKIKAWVFEINRFIKMN